ncbi:polysaccharide pyruvyl transferase family protein [Sphingobacterium sp. SYP-B4668]|uniref:polysaccharide pyruvyl transferase family protein n=1 Tax=Sphingobacterium sp. SYP-B4668 TaxID=2996035 RepID=UPI0022DDB09B|nr:polysaccharide pyruvyl transferase family protein [Sphingobacterium sp. SYP-B4668]
MYKFSIRGGYGVSNFGDDLLMIVFENYLIKEFPESLLNFESQGLNYPVKLLKRSSYDVKSFKEDWLIYGGGTQFFAFSDKNEFTLLQRIRRAMLSPEIILNKIQRYFAKPKKVNIAILGLGLGPFYNEEYISIVKDLLKDTKYIGLRDEQSYLYCRDWDIKATLGADVVFSSYFYLPPFKGNEVTQKSKKIGVIVRDWEWEESGRAYFEPILDFVEDYQSRPDIEIHYILFSTKKDKEWITLIGDSKRIIWNPDESTVDDFLKVLANFDGFISARYHGAIVGALLGKPVIAIEIEPKLRLLRDQIPEMQLWSKPFDLEELKNLVEKMDFNVDYSNSISKLRNASDKMLLEFRELVNLNRL